MATIRDRVQNNKQKLEFYYSIAVIIVIPVVIMVSTLVSTSQVRNDYDAELRRKADTVNNVYGAAIKSNLADSALIQSTIDDITNNNPEVAQLSVLIPQPKDNEFKFIASSDESLVSKVVKDPQITFSVIEQRSVASEKTINDGQKTWGIVTPIIENGEVVGMVAINFGFESVNALISDMFARSFYSLMIVIVVVLLLLLNHFKFVNYAVLFKKLKELDQLKNDFLSVATHELKSPMAVIKGSLENINDGVFGEPNEKMRQSLDLALVETDRLANLVTDLLNVSRIEQGRITYVKEAVNMQENLLYLTNHYRPMAESKGLSLRYEFDNMNYFITADRGRIVEIFTNLIDNAIKYSIKGEVVVSHKVEKGVLKTIIRDTGIGMSAKERDKLFTRFYRIQNEKTQSINGTGLGLWIIKQYIEAMGGKIYVDSLENVGTEFTVEFPLTTQKQITPAA